ncbi:MAG: site-specific integrase [Candidatus Marinimicrobia bacterium]|nr:site-specific integrase [Candidatus Neomarinimicrobiota bacterium]
MENREKKDIHHRNRSYKTAHGKLETDTEIVPRNKVLILQFIRDCRLGKTLKGRQKKSIGTARCLKYIHLLKKISRWLDKPFDQVSQADMERLIEDLENDRYNYNLVGKNGKVIKSKRLAPSTKLDYKKTLRKFYKWLQGNNDHYPELVDWIDTYEEHREIPALRRDEIEQLADSAKLRDKTIIMFLFDSGVRAEEFLNIRVGDLTRIEETYKVRIVFSKTKPRTIHLPICSKYVELWLHESSDRDDQSYLFPITYEGLRMMLHRVSKRVLGKRVTPHILRHSSATYYANLLNHHQLCYRYGWSMASDMPNRYIDREGIIEEETLRVVKANDVHSLEKQNRTLQEEMALVRASNEQISEELFELKRKYENLFKGKGFMALLASLANKQKDMSAAIEQITGKRFDIVLPK